MLCFGGKKLGRRRGKQNFFWDLYLWEFLLDSGMGFVLLGIPAGLWDGIYLEFLGFMCWNFAFFFLTRWNCWIKFLSNFSCDSFLFSMSSWCFSSLLPLLSHLGQPKSSLNSVFVPWSWLSLTLSQIFDSWMFFPIPNPTKWQSQAPTQQPHSAFWEMGFSQAKPL